MYRVISAMLATRTLGPLGVGTHRQSRELDPGAAADIDLALLKALEETDLSWLYRIINHLQQTNWRSYRDRQVSASHGRVIPQCRPRTRTRSRRQAWS